MKMAFKCFAEKEIVFLNSTITHKNLKCPNEVYGKNQKSNMLESRKYTLRKKKSVQD